MDSTIFGRRINTLTPARQFAPTDARIQLPKNSRASKERWPRATTGQRKGRGVNRLPSALKSRKSVAAADLERTLIRLPVTAWRYGRVVAVQENSIGLLDRDDKSIADNLEAAFGVLKKLDIAVERWPS